MKKITFLLLVAFSIFSCSKDEEPNPVLDPILEKFTLEALYEDGISQELPTCADFFYMEFFIFNDGIYELYGDSPNGGCDVTNTANLDWSRNGDIYTITSDVPFLEGTGIPTNTATATLDRTRLIISFSYSGSDYEIWFRQ